MNIQSTKKLTVKYNNNIVGYLAELKNNQIAFQYDKMWIENGFSISPLTLPLVDKIFINSKKTFDGLWGVFWDCLPDGWGELLVRRKLQAEGINFDKLSPLQKLSILNRNGLGALEFEPNSELNTTTQNIELDNICKMVEDIINEAENINLDSIYYLGGSSGGARPKAHICYGGDEWIVKFPCRIDPQNVGVKEFETNELAKQCNINVNEHRLFESKICSGFFGAKRFDRNGERRTHTISLCALLETSHRTPNLDYGHLFQVIETICADKSDLYEAFKRMCFNVYVKNKDDHGKNFAFIYDENLKSYKLSPAYDLTTTPQKAEHEMTVNGNGNPNDDDLLAIAKEFHLQLKLCKEIMQKIKTIANN